MAFLSYLFIYLFTTRKMVTIETTLRHYNKMTEKEQLENIKIGLLYSNLLDRCWGVIARNEKALRHHCVRSNCLSTSVADLNPFPFSSMIYYASKVA